MNVLQRKMFANGDVANSPLVDVTAQIANLSLSGLAPIEIFELLQADYASKGLQMPSDLGMATIERIAQQVGGKAKTDPTFVGPNRPLDPSRIDQIGVAPFNVNPDIAPDRLPPADPSLDPRLGTYTQQGETLNPASQPPIDLSLDIDELLGGTGLVETGLPEVESRELGPNEIRLSDGRIVDFTQGIKDIQEGRGKGLQLYRIFNSPDIERGAGVDEALKQFITDDEPGLLRGLSWLGTGWGGATLDERRGTGWGPEDFGSGIVSAIKGGLDVGRETLERTAPFLVDIFGGKKAADKTREIFEGEFEEGYIARGGFSPEVIDNIVLQAAGTEEDSIAKDLTEIDIVEEEQVPTDVIPPEEFLPTKEEQAAQEEAERLEAEAAAADAAATSGDPERQEVPGDDKKGAEGETLPSVPKTQETTFAEFTRSPDFIRFVRNVGKGLVTTGEMGKGIALGSAAAAEEKAVEERAEKERQAELLKEMMKSGGLDLKDRKDILQVRTDMNASVRDYNNAIAAEELARSVIDFAQNADLTTFAAKIGAKVSDLQKAFTGNPGELSDTKRAQIALDILTNRNIKEILGESGRTISNIDRDIAQRIVGNLNLSTIQSVEEVRNRLEDNIKSIVQKKNEAQRNIKASVIFLAPYGNEAPLDQEVVTIFMSELGQTLPQGTSTSYTPTPGVTFIDTTK